MCSQKDALGGPSLATYRAAFVAENMDVVKEFRFEPKAFDAKGILDAMLAENLDVSCCCTNCAPTVHATREQDFPKGFKVRILFCTLDDYPALVGDWPEVEIKFCMLRHL